VHFLFFFALSASFSYQFQLEGWLLVFKFLDEIFAKIDEHLLEKCVTTFPNLGVLMFQCSVYVNTEFVVKM